MKKKTGYVYYADSPKIDLSDNKKRRRYVVVRDSGKGVSVAKIRGYNNNSKNTERLYELDKSKYPILQNKRCGVDKKVYKHRSDNGKLLRLEDKDVFEKTHSFKLTSHDTHRVLEHTGMTKKGRKK